MSIFPFQSTQTKVAVKRTEEWKKQPIRKNERFNKTRMINAYNLQVPMIKEISYAQ